MGSPSSVQPSQLQQCLLPRRNTLFLLEGEAGRPGRGNPRPSSSFPPRKLQLPPRKETPDQAVSAAPQPSPPYSLPSRVEQEEQRPGCARLLPVPVPSWASPPGPAFASTPQAMILRLPGALLLLPTSPGTATSLQSHALSSNPDGTNSRPHCTSPTHSHACYTLIHMYTHSHTLVYTHTLTLIHTHTHTPIYSYTYTLPHVHHYHTLTLTHIHSHIHTLTIAHTHTHTLTHVHT